jgi:hypothetical protein
MSTDMCSHPGAGKDWKTAPTILSLAQIGGAQRSLGLGARGGRRGGADPPPAKSCGYDGQAHGHGRKYPAHPPGPQELAGPSSGHSPAGGGKAKLLQRVPPCLLECLPGHVLGGAGVGGHGHGDPEDDPLEPAHERDRKVGISRAKAREQCLVGQPLTWRAHSSHPPHTYVRTGASDGLDTRCSSGTTLPGWAELEIRHNRNPFRSVIRKNCVSRFSLDGGFAVPALLTGPARSRQRRPLGRIAVVFALASAVTTFTGTTALAAPTAAQSNPSQITSVNDCSATVGNITQETLNGEAVVTFTGQIECNSSAMQIYIHAALFNCRSMQPEESHVFLAADCGNTTNAETYTPEKSGVTYAISDETGAANAYYARY